MTATTAVMPEDGSVPAGDGTCGRAGCGRPLPAGERGRSRRFCSDECRRRHSNALRGRPAPAAPVPDDGAGAALGRLTQLLAEASRLAVTASALVAEAGPGRVAAVLAEAEAARRSAEAHAATSAAQALAAAAQAAESAESAATAWEAAERWRPVSPTLMTHLLAHAEGRGGLESGERVLRYATGKPITSRRYDYLWDRLGGYLPWVKTQQVSTHWIRHTILTWVERRFGFAVAQAYAGHQTASQGARAMGATGTYVRAGLPEAATALSALTGEPHPLAPEGPRTGINHSLGDPWLSKSQKARPLFLKEDWPETLTPGEAGLMTSRPGRS